MRCDWHYCERKRIWALITEFETLANNSILKKGKKITLIRERKDVECVVFLRKEELRKR